MSEPGWAVELIGEDLDLDDLREMLAPPFDPWVENYVAENGCKALLRSPTWVTLSEASDVVRDAMRMIDRINGELLLFHEDAHPVKHGEVMRFGPDGKREPILFAPTGEIKITMGRVRAKSTPTGERLCSPQESEMQRWFREAEADDVRADLFSHLSPLLANPSSADKWFNLYKAGELAKELAGGKQKMLEGKLGEKWTDWDRARQTANSYRHAPWVCDPPPNPPDFEQARAIFLRGIRLLLNKTASRGT
jgi:hypothetical protein